MIEHRGKLNAGDIWDVTEQERVWAIGDKPLEFIAVKFIRFVERFTLDEKNNEIYYDAVPFPKGVFEKETVSPQGEALVNKEVLEFQIHLIKDLEAGIKFPTIIRFKGWGLSVGKDLISACVKAVSAGKTPASVMFGLTTKHVSYTTKAQVKTNFYVWNINKLAQKVKLDYIDTAFKTNSQKLLD